MRNNEREKQVILEYIDKGYEVLTKGYPDLLCIKNDKIKFIEVKRKQKRITLKGGLSIHQKKVHEILKKNGFDVEIFYIK